MAITIALSAGGCRSPLESGKIDGRLDKTLAQAIARELHALPSEATPALRNGSEAATETEPPSPTSPPGRRQTTRAAGEAIAELAHRQDELEAMGPLARGATPVMELGPDLTGAPQDRINITLQDAISSAVNRNLGIQFAQLQPAISALEVRAAEAVFDALLFANLDLTKTDQPQRVPVIMGVPLGTPFSASERYRFETGIRQPLTTGGSAFISTDITRFANRAPGISFFPDPAYTAAVALGITHPLLRGFGDDFSLATIRLSRIDERRSIQQLQADLQQVTADTERAYWDLVFAWRNLAIAEWLVEVGVEVREVLGRRREFDLDISPAQYSDALARVEQRRADVIRAQRQVRAASDALKLLINDESAAIASEAVLFPLDETVDAPITYDLREAVMTAIDHRPELKQAALNIEDAQVRQLLARNQALPLLDVSAQMAFFGLDDSVEGAYSELGGGDFIDYIVGLAFEYPLGNRAGEARLAQARLQRTAAAIRYRQAVQNVVREVKAALRDVLTNYELISATQSFRLAQAENLRTLLVAEEVLAALTPEFLNLKFTRQETLAAARRQEIQALVNFDQSLAELYRAMGIALRVRGIGVIVEEK